MVGYRHVVGVQVLIWGAAWGTAHAGSLAVGEGKAFARLEDAVARARAGDEIVVYPRGDGSAYRRVALQVRTERLTIRAADAQRPVTLDGEGFNYSGRGAVPRAIVQFDPGADGCVLEGFELINASNESFNGAGVRINQANDVTIRRCRIRRNEMGIMSNGSVAGRTGAGQLIEGCLIADNGTQREAGQNHNLYLGGTSVTVRACEIARSTTGHNLKSRAHYNWIEYNYIHDSSNRELDLVDARDGTDAPRSDAVLLGNFIIKKHAMNGNKAVIHFGKDGAASHDGLLYLVHNTIVTEYVSPVVDLSDGRGAVFINNRVEMAGGRAGGVLVRARAQDAAIRGTGNALGHEFLAALPATLQSGRAVEWERIELPWPAGRRGLQAYGGIGQTTPRGGPAEAGAGQLPR